MVVSHIDYHLLGTCLNMLHCTEPLCVGTRCVCLQQYSANTMQATHPVHLVPASVCAISQPIPHSVLVMYPQRFSCVVLHKSPSRNPHTVKLRWNNTFLSTCIFQAFHSAGLVRWAHSRKAVWKQVCMIWPAVALKSASCESNPMS